MPTVFIKVRPYNEGASMETLFGEALLAQWWTRRLVMYVPDSLEDTYGTEQFTCLKATICGIDAKSRALNSRRKRSTKAHNAIQGGEHDRTRSEWDESIRNDCE